MSGAEEDQVVREVPVFLSKSLTDQLYLIQYLLRPATTSSKHTNILQAKIKPNQDRIQLTVEIDTNTRYDKRKGESLAGSAVGFDSVTYEDELEERPILNEYIMESSPIPNSAKSRRYVVGILRDGQFHLSSLRSIVQMRGTFSHLDDADRNDVKSNLGGDEAGELTKVTVKFSQHRDQPMSKSKYARSYDALRRKREEEPWIELNYISKDVDESEKLFSVIKESETPFYVISRTNYAKAILPRHTKISTERPTENKIAKHKRITISQMRRLLLPDQLRHIMINAKVLRYSQVLDYLKTRLKVVVDEVSVLRSIQTVAVLVQGCWVVKSELLYPVDFVSDSNGLSGVHMQKARDFILSQYTKMRVLERKVMCTQAHIPMEEVTEIISGLGRVVPRSGWEFIFPYDSDFVATFEDVAQRQAIMWEMKAANRNRTTSLDIKPSISLPPRRKSRSRHVSFSSDMDSGAESEGRSKRPGKCRTSSLVHKWYP